MPLNHERWSQCKWQVPENIFLYAYILVYYTASQKVLNVILFLFACISSAVATKPYHKTNRHRKSGWTFYGTRFRYQIYICLVLRISLDIHIMENEQFLEVNYEQRVSPALPSTLSIFNPNWRKLSVHMICCSIQVPSIIKSILMCYHSHKITARRLAGQLANKLCIRRLYARILQTTGHIPVMIL